MRGNVSLPTSPREPLVWILLSAQCHFANQPFHVHFTRQRKYSLGFGCYQYSINDQEWVWNECSNIFHEVYLGKMMNDPCCHFLQVSMVLLRVKEIQVGKDRFRSAEWDRLPFGTCEDQIQSLVLETSPVLIMGWRYPSSSWSLLFSAFQWRMLHWVPGSSVGTYLT